MNNTYDMMDFLKKKTKEYQEKYQELMEDLYLISSDNEILELQLEVALEYIQTQQTDEARKVLNEIGTIRYEASHG
jgi:hypothetical protein